MLANETNYKNQYGTLFMMDREEYLHEKYGYDSTLINLSLWQKAYNLVLTASSS
jgi:hypothetical protein